MSATGDTRFDAGKIESLQTGQTKSGEGLNFVLMGLRFFKF